MEYGVLLDRLVCMVSKIEKAETLLLEDFNCVKKVVIGGEGGVGKTSLVKYLKNEAGSIDLSITIGVEFHILKVSLPSGKPVKLQVWDLAGQEQFKSMCVYSNFFAGSRVFILVFDMTDVKTFANLSWWLENVYKNSEQINVPLIVVGNKMDLKEEKTVFEKDIEAFKKRTGKNFSYIEVSAKTGENIDTLFEKLLNILDQQVSLLEEKIIASS